MLKCFMWRILDSVSSIIPPRPLLPKIEQDPEQVVHLSLFSIFDKYIENKLNLNLNFI